MKTREIPKASWESFLDGFSRQHEFWRVSLEIVDPRLEAHAEIEELPLVGIGMSEGNIVITLQNHDGRRTTQMVHAPAHLRLEETEEGAHKSLQIESADGLTTVVSFRSAILPERMDGIVGDQAGTETG